MYRVMERLDIQALDMLPCTKLQDRVDLMRIIKAGVIRHSTGQDSGHPDSVGLGLVEMAISTNQKPAIYRN